VFGLRIRGEVDVRLLEESLSVIARRHSALRTFFPRDLPPGKAACMYPEAARWDLRVAVAGDDGSGAADQVKWLHEPFELWQPPLMRAVLLSCGPSDWLIGLAVDHLNFDGASVGALSLDLSRVWMKLAEGARPDQLAEPVVPYVDFIEWQWKWLDRFGPEALAYWIPRWEKSGKYPKLPIAQDGQPQEPNASGRIWQQSVPLPDLQRMYDAVGANNSYFSLFMLVATALFHVLSKTSEDELLGLLFPFANRLMPGSEQAVGYYINRLVLTIPRPTCPRLRDTAEAVRSATISALEYAPLPYGLISSTLFADAVEQRPGEGYLFLNVQDAEQSYRVPGGSAVSDPMDSAEDFSDYPSLTVVYTLDRASDQMILYCGYSSRFYSPDTVHGFMSEVIGTLTQGV
jgi:hypothetical protein